MASDPHREQGTSEHQRPAFFAAFFAVDFHRRHQRFAGPYAVFGNARIGAGGKWDHWAVLSAIGENYDSFTRSGTTLLTAVPKPALEKVYPGVEEVTFFELPLGLIRDAEMLKKVVTASIAASSGNYAPGEEIRGAWQTARRLTTLAAWPLDTVPCQPKPRVSDLRLRAIR